MDQLSGALQENVLTLVCTNDQYCQLVRNSIPPRLFSTYVFRDIVERVYAYVDQFKHPPKEHLADLLEDVLEEDSEKARNVESIVRNVAKLGESLNAEYVINQLEKFTRQQELKLGIVEATKELQDGNIDKAQMVIERALRNKLSLFDAGLTLTEAYKTIRQRPEGKERVILQIPELDRRDYGPSRGELHLFIAPPKKGKSWWLVHATKRAIMQRWRVVYVTLELEDQQVGQRSLQSLFSMTKNEVETLRIADFETDQLGRLVGIGSTEIPKRPHLQSERDLKELGKKLRALRYKDHLMIKRFPTGQLTVHMLEAYLETLANVHKFVPDMVVLDYADIMKVDPKNYRMELGALYRDLRGLAVERNLALVTASQSNREGAKAKTVTGEHAAEDYSKIAISDAVITYNQTLSEKALGIARLFVTAGRNDEDKFNVIIKQSYPIGQFCLESRMMDRDYWSILGVSNGVVEEEEGEGEGRSA